MRVRYLLLLVVTSFVYAEESKPEIIFLDKALGQVYASRGAGREAIVDDKDEPYFNTLQPIEMSAKTGSPITGETLKDQRAECWRRYYNAVLDFTDDEKAMVSSCIKKIYPLIQNDYPLYAKIPWSFIKFAGIEGDFPHTRGAHVLISEKVLERFVAFSKKRPEQALPGIATLLLHEQFHVFQRLNPKLIGKLYTDVWGFKYAGKIAGADGVWLTGRHLANPDGLDCGWIFPITDGDKTRYIWPLVVFAATEKPQRMGTDFRMIGINLKKADDGFAVELNGDSSPVYKPLAQITEYAEKFGRWGENFHPNEISAEMFARIVVTDSLLPKDKIPVAQLEALEKDIGPVRKWLKENLKQAEK